MVVGRTACSKLVTGTHSRHVSRGTFTARALGREIEVKIITDASVNALTDQQNEWAYNGFDAAVTEEVRLALEPKLAADPIAASIYRFERAMQGPAMTMQLRGMRVNATARKQVLGMLKGEAKAEQRELSKLHEFRFLKSVAPSTQQVQKFLYETVGIPVHKNKTGRKSADKDVLRRIAKKYPKVREFCHLILSLRDKQKQIEEYEKGLSPDGRMRSCWNAGATETGRWSCSKDVYNTGTNMQNQDRRIRHMFVADPGWVLFNADLEQSDSRCIAYLAEDEAYIEAHEKGNVHVVVARLFWKDALSAENGPLDEQEQPTGVPYAEVWKRMLKATPVPWIKQAKPKPGEEPSVSYYDMAKRMQHALNFGLEDYGLAQYCGVTQEVARGWRDTYFSKYPRIERYHAAVKAELARTGYLKSPAIPFPFPGDPPVQYGRKFLGRSWDPKTLKEALAHVPQNITSTVIKIGLWRVWNELDPEWIQVLLEGHDAITGQYAPSELPAQPGSKDWILNRVRDLMRVEVSIHGRTMIIPIEITTGPNWRDVR